MSQHADYMRSYRDGLPRRLDSEPLVRFAKLHWDRLDKRQRDYVAHLITYPARRVSVYKADELCISIGFHPANVYGDDWWAAA